MVADGHAGGGGARASFPDRRRGQGDSVRCLRHGTQGGLRERGLEPRHTRVRVGVASALLASDGLDAYPDASTLFITADAGGRNGYRSRPWKHELQHLADETGLTIEVSHFPPDTSK